MAIRDRFASPGAVAIAGMLSLAVGVGVGRFAFTPMLPFMIRDGQVNVAGGGWLAAANYIGYFVGALLAARMTFAPAQLGSLSLAAVVVTTAAMALGSFPAWAVLRFAAGVFSAWAFVATSVWCLGSLARLQRSDLSGWVYSGVGSGIAAAGVYCLFAGVAEVTAGSAWMHLAILAAAMCVPVFLTLKSLALLTPSTGSATQISTPAQDGNVGLVVSYGLMGFGFILPATFLPVMARGVVEDPSIFGLAWPLYGLTAAISTLLAVPLISRFGRLNVWASSQALMGLGAVLPSLSATRASIFLAAVLVGGTFMVITLAGVQEVRSRSPSNPGPWVGYITAAFGLGQIAGASAPAFLLALPEYRDRALSLCLQLAATALFASAVWLWRQALSRSIQQEPKHVQ